MSLQAAMQRRPAEVGNTGLQGIETIIQRQQSVAVKGHDNGLFAFSQNR